MESSSILKTLTAALPKAVIENDVTGVFPSITVSKNSLLEVLQFLKQSAEMNFNFLESITARDTGQDFIVIYQLLSLTNANRINVKVALERHLTEIPSICGLWSGARYSELEASEMLGLTFVGHPCPKPLFLPEDWIGNPLRKDYVYPETYQGIEHRRQPLRKEHVRP